MTTRPALIEQINKLTRDINDLENIYEGHFPEPSEQLDHMNELTDKRQALVKQLHEHITDDEMRESYNAFTASLGYKSPSMTYERFKQTTHYWVYMPELNED